MCERDRSCFSCSIKCAGIVLRPWSEVRWASAGVARAEQIMVVQMIIDPGRGMIILRGAGRCALIESRDRAWSIRAIGQRIDVKVCLVRGDGSNRLGFELGRG